MYILVRKAGIVLFISKRIRSIQSSVWLAERPDVIYVFNKYHREGAVWKIVHWDDEYYSQGPDIVCGHQTV